MLYILLTAVGYTCWHDYARARSRSARRHRVPWHRGQARRIGSIGT